MLLRLLVTVVTACLLPLHVMAQRTEAVAVRVTGGILHGTLTVPAAVGKPPVALIIPNTGSVDRNGNTETMVNNSLKLVSDSLAKHGIASLRFDKRGIGESKAITDESRILFSDYVGDSKALLQWLRKQRRFGSVFIVGHGEGALIGMLTARAAPVAGLVSIAGPGQAADSIILNQLTRQGLRPGPMDTTKMLLTELRRNGKVQAAPPGDFYQSLFRPSIQRYLYSWIRYIPTAEMAALRCPVLLVQGDKDIQMDSAQIGYLQAAAPKAQVLRIPGMNHVLRQAPADFAENFATAYESFRPVDPTLIKALVQFMKQGR